MSQSNRPADGLGINRLGYGAMQLPGPMIWGPPTDKDAALAVLRRAVELGVDHIDTSVAYGPEIANELIREALHPYPECLALDKLTARHGATRSQVALAWLLAMSPATLLIPGTKSVAHLEENLRAGSVQLTDADIEELNKLA